jgi:hypothetical protein
MIALFWLMGASLATSSADDSLDPAVSIVDRLARSTGADVLYGARTASARGLAQRWARVVSESPEVDGMLAPEINAADWAWAFRPMGRMVAGDISPSRQMGDSEPGVVGARARLDTRAYWHSVEVMIAPELRVDELEPSVVLPLGWAGVHTANWRAGFGVEERWMGPGRHGGLMLTDHARPAPLGSVSHEGRLGERWGRIRAEAGAGWLDAPRTDVNHPGWLLMDVRWAPHPIVEIGATRMSIFGGSGRPTPKIGQLIIPTDPHVEDDPDGLLPDQDEIAAIDLRVTLPVGTWLNGPRSNAGHGLALDYLEVWMQYGGEDVIARSIGPLPVPSLAGIANLWGGEIGLGALTANLEWARVMDDRFRWYTGHRIYHEGFVQEGKTMGHPSGGDSRTWTMAVKWLPGLWGVEVLGSDRLKVGAIDIGQGQLRTLSHDERAQTLGLRGWWMSGERGWWHGGLSIEQTENPAFQPVAAQRSWRVHIGR